MRNFFASYFQASSVKLPEEPHFKIRFDAITIRPLVIQVKNKNDLRPRGKERERERKILAIPFACPLRQSSIVCLRRRQNGRGSLQLALAVVVELELDLELELYLESVVKGGDTLLLFLCSYVVLNYGT